MEARFEFHVTIGHYRWEATLGERTVQEDEWGVTTTVEREEIVSDFNEFVLWCLARVN